MTPKRDILLIILIGLTLYLNSLYNSFIGDDFLQIVNNAQVHSLENFFSFFTSSTYETGGANKIAGLFYRPLMLASYSAIYTIFGSNTAIFHLFQVLFHTANAVLFFLVLRFFLRNTLSFCIALIFLVHPINNEAVVYSANLQEVLFFFFGMLSLFVLRGLSKLTLKTALLPSFLILLSLLSKESGILFLVITIFFSFSYIKSGSKYLILSHLLALALYLLLRYPIAKIHLAQESITPLYNAHIADRLIQIPTILFYYLKTFLFPLQITSHHFWMIRSINFSNFFMPLFMSGLFFLFLLSLGVYIYKSKRKIFRNYLFFFIWFSIGLGLHLQIYPLDMTVADRWFYFPIVGLLGMIGTIVNQIKIKSVFISRTGITLLIILIGALSYRTFLRNFDWRDELTLFGKDIKTTPDNFVLDNLYASALLSDGQISKAKPYVSSSIKEYPFYANLNNMAIIYASEGNLVKAKEFLKQSVDNSNFYVVYENYSNFLFIYDDINEAESFTKEALKMFPENPRLWSILAKIKYFKGDFESAVKHAEKAYIIYNGHENKEVLDKIKKKGLDDPRMYRIIK
jgi:tetratricopeptide (TPR) repeat protein